MNPNLKKNYNKINLWLLLALFPLLLVACEQTGVNLDNPAATGNQVTGMTQALNIQTDLLGPALQDALEGNPDKLEVIYNFDETITNTASVTDALQGLGAGVVTFKHLSMVAALATPEQITAMKALPGAESIYLNKRLNYLLAESLESIRAVKVHNELDITGEGVGIAILDSGVDGLYATDLKYPEKTVQNVKFIVNTRDLYSFQGTPEVGFKLFIEDVPNTDTSVGHGTHVAGIAAGTGEASGVGRKYKGVAPGADVIGIGTGDVIFIFFALAGFDYILEYQDEYNIQVVNNSWGTTGEFNPENPINEATKELHDAGVTVVFAAGNAGPKKNTLNPYSVAPWVISVAAGCKTFNSLDDRYHCEDSKGRNVLAGFSSRGIPGSELYHPDITAPGVHIVSSRASTGFTLNVLDAPHDAQNCDIAVEDVDKYTCASGTSMASPHVAGVVALMEQATNGNITPDQILEIITQTARPLPAYERWEVGAGYLDAYEAVKVASRRYGNGLINPNPNSNKGD